MTAEHFLTVADPSQLEGIFNGPFLKGYREPRVAFVGRSNVGKSSLLNALVGVRVAQTSSQPGKTRAIHFYHWKSARKIVVDLPGYGYARAARADREKWEGFISAYLGKESNLEKVLLLLDARHGPTENDQEAIDYFRAKGIPITFVFSKSDTLKNQSERALRKREANDALVKQGIAKEKIDSVLWVSIEDKQSLKLLTQKIESSEPI